MCFKYPDRHPNKFLILWTLVHKCRICFGQDADFKNTLTKASQKLCCTINASPLALDSCAFLGRARYSKFIYEVLKGHEIFYKYHS